MQRVSTFTVFFKESPTCHMQTSLTPPVEQEMKVRPGSIMTKLTEAPFQNHSFLPQKAAGSEGCTYAGARGSSQPQTATPTGITRVPRGGGLLPGHSASLTSSTDSNFTDSFQNKSVVQGTVRARSGAGAEDH